MRHRTLGGYWSWDIGRRVQVRVDLFAWGLGADCQFRWGYALVTAGPLTVSVTFRRLPAVRPTV